ncbi:protein translocase SEC61 complex subunit gamma [archaeon]|nr:protein translocase SEC61 complex subunit gamma [archaeon]|tara:strand:+ start:5354 stop:5527 length:174 start_codon:yes stop_codon:yes gene_type:complete
MLEKVKIWLIEAKRVLKVTKRPNRLEFMTIVKVTGVGILLIGLMGFIINMGFAFITS